MIRDLLQTRARTTCVGLLLALNASAVDGPLKPEESLKHFQVEPGLRVELVAAEPMVVDPVAIAWDEHGRMFVVEDRGYPIGPGKGKPPAGQIVLLEDTDHDGKYDRRTVYADGLTFPNGVMPWKGGIYVTCAPDLFYFKDTDGDGRADVREVVFKGFQSLSTTQLRVSHPTLSLDNWVYLTSGLTAAKVTSPARSNQPPVMLNRVDGRFRPGTYELEETAGTAQFGQTFDRFGRKFVCSNRNHIQQIVMQTRYLKRNPHFSFSEVVEDIPDHGAACRVYPLSANITTAASHTGYFTSACGLLIYLGTALPEKYLGNSFTCEPAGNLVHHDVLGSTGVTFVASRAYPTNEFLASPDNWFRPVNLAVGPDGALYICDMYRKTIEHPDYLPEATRKITDFDSGRDRGRIYRVTGPAGTKPDKVEAGSLSSRQLVAELENPNIWWRMTAQRLLLERQDKKVAGSLGKLARKGRTPQARVHALRALEGLSALEDEQIAQAFEDKDAGVREQAIQLAEPRLSRSTDLRVGLVGLASDPDARVRFQCALTMGEVKDSTVVSSLAKVVRAGLGDKWTRAAVLTSIAGREEKFLDEMLSDRPKAEGFSLLMGDLGHILSAALPVERIPGVLSRLASSESPADLAWELAAVGGLGEGLRVRGVAKAGKSALMSLSDSPELVGKLQRLIERSSRLAVESQAPMESRLAAMSLLSQAGYERAGRILETLIDPQQPSEVQSAAIRALGQMAEPGAGAALVKPEHWSGYTPAVRDVVLSSLMSSTNLLHALFTAIEKGDVPAWTVNADRRTALMRHKDEQIKSRATAVFKDLVPGDRMKIYEEYKSVLGLKTDSKNGHVVFQKNCVTCHVVSGEGKVVGPDLTGIRNQPADVLLLHIIVPEYEIMPIYTCYNVETREGQGFTGLLAGETPGHITLRMSQGVDQQIARSEIASMATSRLSLMPQELEKAMSRQDLADLIAFLKGE